MNNIVDIKRFGLVLSKDFREKWKKYGLQFLTMFGIMAVILTLWLYSTYNHSNYSNNHSNYSNFDNMQLLYVASFLFLGFGIIFASTFMESMREKTGRIAYLTIPASDVEKFISRWLIVTIGYIIAFFIALWMADAVRVAILSYSFPKLDIRLLDWSKLINPAKENRYSDYVFYNKDFFLLCISIYALLQSLFILGATFWEKASFVKTFSAIVGIGILYILLNKWMIHIVHDDINHFGESLGNIFEKNRATENTAMLFFGCIFAFFTLLNWIIAFFRFRESEIIKRL